MSDFHAGQHLNHPDHGQSIVNFVGSDYVGLELDDGRHVMVKKESFIDRQITKDHVVIPHGVPASWPESTFIFEGPEAKHYMGSHWDPFIDDISVLLQKLKEIIQVADIWEAGEKRQSKRIAPPAWQEGAVLVWPNQKMGVMLILCKEEKGLRFINAVPFISEAELRVMTLQQVSVYENGVEAQVTVAFGPTTLTFFDIGFGKNKLWYEAGKNYEFVIVGIAYDAKPAEIMELNVERHPDEIAWQQLLAKQKNEPTPEITTKFSLEGMAMLIPRDEWDRDDYSFRGTVKEIRVADGDILGETGWLVTVTVLRQQADDFNLHILITHKVWQGNDPPAVGQDIEGSFWLQGYLNSSI